MQDNLAETQKNFEFIKGYYSETEKNSEFTKDFVLVDLCNVEKKIIFCENIFILKNFKETAPKTMNALSAVS